ncbi:asparagine synthase-related protein [Thalassospira tepidiphila]|uniref:asparagine synthase-related protein n=1 Tax=Thalassospira tepidiphila TaxID=393657 RepID=UPI003AA8DBEB
MNILLHNPSIWEKKNVSNCTVYLRGTISNIDAICNGLNAKDFAYIAYLLNTQNSTYAIIVETIDQIFAAVDHVRSIPLFFDENNISDNARCLTSNHDRLTVNSHSVKQMSMTGYVTGNSCIYDKICSILPGQYATFIPGQNINKENIHNYFRYISNTYNSINSITIDDQYNSNSKSEFSSIMNSVFSDLVDRISGRKVLLPLSGGLDSRIVLTNLLEHGHTNILAFSYGVPGNGEMLIAKKIANRLGVEWIPLPSRPGNARRLYQSRNGQAFANYVDGLSITPSWLDFEALHQLKELKHLDNEPVLINGQTGDFIAGAHIPHHLLTGPAQDQDVEISLAAKAIKERHFRQRTDLHDSYLLNEIEDGLRSDIFGDHNTPNNTSTRTEDIRPAWALFEYWEWKERQSKAVMVGQRSYDFFGIDWDLPLWDRRLVDFFVNLHPELKKDRLFLVEWLKETNYGQVFDRSWPEIDTWPKGRSWIKLLARAAYLIGGTKLKAATYDRLYYYSTYQNQFALFGYANFTKRSRITKSFVGQATIEWLENNNIPVP